MLVRSKLAGDAAPVTLAVTVKAPPTEFAVNLEDVAWPELLVMSVSVVLPLANVPLGPEVGAVNVTFSPPVPTPLVVTVAVSGRPNALPLTALCGEPLVVEIATT